MPTPTYIPLATKTLTATATSVTFSSISQAYRDLVLVVSGTASAGSSRSLFMRFNGDAGTNYSTVSMQGNGSTAASSTSTLAQTFGGFLGATSRTSNVTQIMDYSATDKHKTVLARHDDASTGENTLARASRWANTSAITSIYLVPNADSIAIGSTFTLYGIASA